MQALFMKYTLDSFGRVGFGTDIGSLERDVDFPLHFDSALRILNEFFFNPLTRTAKIVCWPYPFTEQHKKQEYRDHITKMNEFIYKWIEETREDGTDLLSQFKKMVEGQPNSKVPFLL